jgi:hypothetical protein
MIPLAYFLTLLKPSNVDGTMTPSNINQLFLTPTMIDVGHFYRGIDLRHNKSSNLGVNLRPSQSLQNQHKVLNSIHHFKKSIITGYFGSCTVVPFSRLNQ